MNYNRHAQARIPSPRSPTPVSTTGFRVFSESYSVSQGSVNPVPITGDFNKAATAADTNYLRIEVAWEENGKPANAALCDLMCLVDKPAQRHLAQM